ncbi:SDR family NAD(P)-dependent oxidoreductase [Hoeflea sp. TYP-13]|uniref:SDR family NAD(P)-dependent oxidoreductase n=1 Tax=Hoeflea sp. TYP-13 TaxID=3230023 RepID=UPI0034C65AFA
MDLGIADCVALVTGAARGIGRAEAFALAREGANVVVNDVDREAACECAAELADAGFEVAVAIGDVSDPDNAKRVVDEAAASFGRLDILVNNAGSGGEHLGHLVEDTSADSWQALLDSHLTSTFLCSKAALAHLGTDGFGRIINTSSMNFTGGGRPGVANYSAAKAGILGFTRTFAKEVGRRGITVNAIAPGYVETALIAGFTEDQRCVVTSQNPTGRFCQADEVGAVVAFLCARQSGYINGSLICIDGGKRDYHWS